VYAELHALSNFSFLRGASQPEELVLQAKALGYRALALTDECSLAGIVRAHVAAKEHGLQLIVGAELRCSDDLKLVALATSRAGYGALSRLISQARRAVKKGTYRLVREHLEHALDGCLLIWLPAEGSHPCAPRAGPLAAGAVRRLIMDRRGIAHERCRYPAARHAGNLG
jgi:error-prone DNA polymerase